MILHTSAAQAIEVVAMRLKDLSGTRWVGVDGLGASGKTSLAGRLSAALSGSVVVHVDDFARPDLRGWDRDRFEQQVLQPLLAGRPARFQRWDFDSNTGADWLEVQPGRTVVVEGVSATDVRLAVPWDVTLWVDAPAAVRWQRIIERDGERLRERWLTDWIPAELAYEHEQQPRRRVDLIVEGFC